MPSSLASALLVALFASPTPAAAAEDKVADADDGVSFVVLRENATGSASAAQRYIDQLIVAIAKTVGWPVASGKYHTRRSSAVTFIRDHKPHYGILSLSAYLALHEAEKLQAIGMADIKSGGGHQFFIVSKNHATLAGCKGATLGTNYGDATFVDKVVSGDDFDLSDFEVVDTRRPVKTLKEVVSGAVECAFIDDAQLMELQHLDGGLQVQAIWSSPSLPPMVVVAFPPADAEQTKKFKGSLDTLCAQEGKEACAATSITLEAADAGTFASYAKAYAR